MKTGTAHLESLRDGRTVYIDGAEAGDVTRHPAFRNAVASAASLFDFQAANADMMTILSPPSGERVNRAWDLPTPREPIVPHPRALHAWPQTHKGFPARPPDPV